jgi:hypothetical protein
MPQEMIMKRTQKLALALLLSIASVPVSAAVWTSTPTKFTPTPMSEDRPLRFLVNIDNANVFSGGPVTGMNGYLAKDGKVGLMNIQLNLALMYSVGMGFDVGLGLHGGIQSPYGMFFGDNMPSPRYGAMFGADVMARYLTMFSDVFYGGIQAQVGYNYTDTLVTPESHYTTTFGQKSKAAFNSFIPVVAGVVLGADFEDTLAVYVFPAIELGQTGNYTNTVAPSASDMDKGIWKSAVGMQIGVGTAIHTKMGDIVIQATPRIANFSNKHSWGFDLTTGMQLDF